jgi:hypothetical protein
MRSSFPRSTLNTPSSHTSRGGARRHLHPNLDVPRVGRRAPARLSTTVTKTESTHTNRSPINPVHFTRGPARRRGRRAGAACDCAPAEGRASAAAEDSGGVRLRPSAEGLRHADPHPRRRRLHSAHRARRPDRRLWHGQDPSAHRPVRRGVSAAPPRTLHHRGRAGQ